MNWKLNYLLTASLLPVAILHSFSEFCNSSAFLKRLIYLLLTFIMLMGLSQMQARFSGLFAVIGIFVLMIINYKKLLNTYTGVIFVFSLLVFSYDLMQIIMRFKFYSRLQKLDIQNFDRVEIIKIYLNLVEPVWITGFGLKGTPITKYFYPHNYLLEFFTEFGFIGLFFIIMISVYSLFYVITVNSSNGNDRFVSILLIYYVMFFLKSATIYDAYVLFICFGVALAQLKNSRSSHVI